VSALDRMGAGGPGATAARRVPFAAVLTAADTALLRLLRTRGHQPPIERAILALTQIGEHGAVWIAIAAAGALLDRDARPVYRRAAAAVVSAYALNTAIKWTVRRARPVLHGLPALAPTISGKSYPSAHASTSFAAAGVLSQRLPALPLYGLALALALSRPYLGVHYPSDSLAGATLGCAVAGAMR
jgi:membrane-associated phospholipid phosphatase